MIHTVQELMNSLESDNPEAVGDKHLTPVSYEKYKKGNKEEKL